MDEFSLYILDIVMNSVRAGAKDITIILEEKDGMLYFTVIDNGCGMTKEQLRKLTDPFFTTRTTRDVGLGVPFLKMLSEQTGGTFEVTSVSKADSPDSCGTTLKASFGLNHIDFIPLGNITDTVVTLIQGDPEINFDFTHKTEKGTVHLSCSELKNMLGDNISLAEFEVLAWIRDYLTEAYESIR